MIIHTDNVLITLPAICAIWEFLS